MAPGPDLTISITEKRYPGADTAVLAGVNITIAPGSVTAILGPSGVGKSTLLRLIAGIDREFSGDITIAGQSAADAAPAGFLFQDPRLLPWLTTLDNVRTAGSGVTTERAMSALSQTGMAAHANLYPHQLSGGMQRRAALARALTLNAGLLLLDEPFVSLDRALVDDLHDLVATIVAAAQPTVILVTHMPEDAARLADRVLILSGQPAGIAADIALPLPRERRDRSVLEAYRQTIESAT